jgi:hypothetical protein
MVRTASDPQQIAHAAAARITGVDRNIVVSRILTLEQIVGRAAWQDRFFAVLFTVFAFLAAMLAPAGCTPCSRIRWRCEPTKSESEWHWAHAPRRFAPW